MKGLKEFIEDLAKDSKLREKFKDLKDVKEIVKLAKKKGYEFTEDEYMDKQLENVSGGVHYITRPPERPDMDQFHGGLQKLREYEEKLYSWMKENDLALDYSKLPGPPMPPG